jgi:hypothetical protein
VTQPGYRHRIIVMDRSGSINDILEGQQSGLSEFFGSEGQVPGDATYSLWDFDTRIRCVHSFASLNEVKDYKIEPRGGTAMYDAVGDAVNAEGAKLAGLPEDKRPEDVTVIVASDGLENSSQRWTGTEVKNLLAVQQDTYKWRVIYMGCNQDAFKEGEKIGTRRGLTVNTVSSDAGSRNSWKMSANYLSRVPVASAAAPDSLVFSDKERALGESGDEEPEQAESLEKEGDDGN